MEGNRGRRLPVFVAVCTIVSLPELTNERIFGITVTEVIKMGKNEKRYLSPAAMRLFASALCLSVPVSQMPKYKTEEPNPCPMSICAGVYTGVIGCKS